MDPCLPDWNFESELPFTNQKKPSGPNNDLVELLWQNGQVVMHSQTHRRPGLNHFDSQQLPRKQNGHNHHSHPQRAGGGGNSDGSYGNSSVLIQDDETVSWIRYPVEDSFEMEFCSHFFNELPAPDAVETDKPILAVPDQSSGRPSCGQHSSRVPNSMPPPSQPAQVQFPNPAVHQNHGPTKAMDLSQLSRPVKGDVRHSNPHFGTAGDVRECSGMTVGSSHCGSNQVVLNNPDFSRASSYGTGTVGLCSKVFAEDYIPETVPHDDGRKTETIEPTLTSSSGGSGSSLGGTQKNFAGISSSLKRKGRDAEDSDNQSEAAELESGGGKNPSQRSGSTRRSRAAEVHNLSERRRRDRINKKMKALQELIPHCNKTDKASMLDEAIEYLKSLQMQLQMMWIGSGMAAPMMFPGMQPYMSPMGIGMGPHPLATLHNSMNLPRVPMVDPQSMAVAPQNRNVMCQAPVLNPVNFPNQMQNQSLTEQFACYMGMQQLQAAASQPMSMFRFSPQSMPTSQVNNRASGTSNDDASSGKIS